MPRQARMRILLVIASVLILIGVLLAYLTLTRKSDPDVIEVRLTNGKTNIVSFEDLALIPGQSAQYTVKLKPGLSSTCTLGLDFVEVGSQNSLKDYARVRVMAKDTVLYDESMAIAFEKEGLVFPVNFLMRQNTELEIIYYLPIEVGNEAENAEAAFELHLTAYNE